MAAAGWEMKVAVGLMVAMLMMSGCSTRKEAISPGTETQIRTKATRGPMEMGPADYIVHQRIGARNCFVLYRGTRAESISCTQ